MKILNHNRKQVSVSDIEIRNRKEYDYFYRYFTLDKMK